MIKRVPLITGIVIGVLFAIILSFQNWSFKEIIVSAAITTMAIWWISECIPIYVTALFPLVIFPLAGIVPMKELAPLYMQEVIFLFIGGFIVAYAIERSGLHKRIALKIILMSGSSLNKILLGFMLASYLLSMWILNTATVTMLIPAVLAVLHQLGKEARKVSSPLLLGIAYASSIGGMATLVGTVPNMILKGQYNEHFSQLEPITFASWAAVGVPLSLVLFVVTFFILKWKFIRNTGEKEVSITECKTAYQNLGPLSTNEKWISVVFVLLAVSWVTIKKIKIGNLELFGWSELFPDPSAIKESTVAMFFALVLYLIPRPRDKELLTWNDVRRIPIGIIFLFGAGYALVASFNKSGLSARIEEMLAFTHDIAPYLIILSLCLIMTFMTELTSNTTSINLFIPILFPLATMFKSEPLSLIMPVTFCASCAFMLPVATPPNTIVFGSERLPIKDMVSTGLVLNIVSVIIISFAGYFFM